MSFFFFFTSQSVLYNCRLSCPHSDPQDPTQSDYNECKPEQHKTHLSEENLTQNGFNYSHLIADGYLERLQIKGERRRVVTGEELCLVADAFRDTPEQILFQKYLYRAQTWSQPASYPLLVMMG